jgi:hypothetical protein
MKLEFSRQILKNNQISTFMKTRQTNIHILNGIQTQAPSNWEAAGLRLITHGYWGRLNNSFTGINWNCYYLRSVITVDALTFQK